MSVIKGAYRQCKWQAIRVLSSGRSTTLSHVNPADIVVGQTPSSQFPVRSTYKFTRDGDWDKEVVPVEDHLLYRSYVMHFIEQRAWEDTPFFQFAMEQIDTLGSFRGEYNSVEMLRARFSKCDALYRQIESDGYKSNRALYAEGKIDNILFLLDEVTVNISRDGQYILNDGWHRFASARLLNIENIPVRILVSHACYGKN